MTSTRPYLIRALYEWCTDNGFTPHVVVRVDGSVQVPREFVKDGEIVLNISLDATSGLQLGNDFIEFKARFGGKPCEIMVPVGRVVAIYARENGQGMAFPEPVDHLGANPPLAAMQAASAPEPAQPPAGAGDERVVQLVSSTEAGADAGHASPDADPPPAGPGAGKRPALKRIK